MPSQRSRATAGNTHNSEPLQLQMVCEVLDVFGPVEQRPPRFRVGPSVSGPIRGNDAQSWWEGIAWRQTPGEARSRKPMKEHHRRTRRVAVFGKGQVTPVGKFDRGIEMRLGHVDTQSKAARVCIRYQITQAENRYTRANWLCKEIPNGSVATLACR